MGRRVPTPGIRPGSERVPRPVRGRIQLYRRPLPGRYRRGTRLMDDDRLSDGGLVTMAVLEHAQGTAAAPSAVGGPAAEGISSAPRDVSRLGALGSTPRRLRVLAGSLLALLLVAGGLAVATVVERQAATSAARQHTAPLVVDAQAVDIALSDADATAAGSFLEGRIQPAALRSEYLADTARASTVLAAAEQDAGGSSATSASLRTVATDLPLYTGLVATASAAERQASYPLAAAYLAEANNLMRTSMLPAVTRVYSVESSGLTADEGRASRSWLAVLTGLVLLVLLVAMVAIQVWMGRRFRRTFSLPLVVATAIVLVVGVWFGAALSAQGAHVDKARTSGSVPLGTYTQARILALELRADDELTLLTRDSVPSYQQDAGRVALSLHRLLAADRGIASDSARTEAAAVQAVHDQIRSTDRAGDLPSAVALATGTGPRDLPARSSALDASLATGVTTAQQSFGESMAAADGDLAGLGWGTVVALLVAAGLVALGFRPRIAEYR